MQDIAGGLDPVVEECGLHLPDHRTLHAKVHVAPVIRVLGMALPLIRDPDPAGEADVTVAYEHFAVGAIIDAARVIPSQWVVSLHLDTGTAHPLHQLAIYLLAPHPIEHDVNTY